jgi:Zn-dependent protease with chaperone function
VGNRGLWRSVLCGWTALAALGCATPTHEGRQQIVAPRPVSEVYSEVDLRFTMVTTPDLPNNCIWSECELRVEFDQRVARLGARLAQATAELYPDTARHVKRFEFLIADKAEAAITSTADGRIVVFRPVGQFALRDEALAFLLAREMGHVIARHHDENVGTGLLFSALAHVLLPATALVRAFAEILPVANATFTASSAATASVTAASLAGSQLVVAAYRPMQLEEADVIAQRLLAQIGIEPGAVTRAFPMHRLPATDSRWMQALRDSIARLAPAAQGKPAETARAEPAPRLE